MKTFCSSGLFVLFALIFVLGCASTSPLDQKPRFASTINVAVFDTTPRPATQKLNLYQAPEQLGNQPYHVIALLEHPGEPKDEADIMNAIAWRARHMGADGLIILPSYLPNQPTAINAEGFPSKAKVGKAVFRVSAIVFDAKPAAH